MREFGVQTFWLLKVSTTLSAPSFVSNTISAMTFGFSAMITQLITSPPMGAIALSISAAVVPGARFFATTQNGPVAVPRIDIDAPGLDEPTMLNWLFNAGEEAEFDKALRSLSEWLLLLRTARGPRGGAFEGPLFRSCRS